MKRYLLLRNNHQSGPYTYDEMIASNLKPMDLIWIDGESNSWKYATEIDALSPFVQKEVKKPSVKTKVTSSPALNSNLYAKNVFVALPPQNEKEIPQPAVSAAETVKEKTELETLYNQSLEDLKERYNSHVKSRQFSFPKYIQHQNAFWILGLFLGLLVSAVLIKKMVASFDEQAFSNATSVAVLPAQVLPVTEPDPDYKNALTTEIVPIDTTEAKPAIKTASKKENVNKLVRISANNYKIGVFGGINKLKLNINNKSDHVLDKVTIEVEYLKPNGETISKDKYYMKSVGPKSIQSMEVPSSKRGVKVKYRITNIKSHPYKAGMLEV